MIDKGFSTENHTGVRIYPISIPDKGRRKPVNTPASILNPLTNETHDSQILDIRDMALAIFL